MTRPFLVSTAELFRQRGTRHDISLAGRLPGLELSSSRLGPDDVVADVVLEAQGDTVTVTGTVSAGWVGDCRRCLGDTSGDITVEVSEVFEPDPVEGETYPLGRDHLDLEPVVREALALALPLAPLCDEACAGPDPAAHPVATASDDADDDGPAPDPRWGALDALNFDN